MKMCLVKAKLIPNRDLDNPDMLTRYAINLKRRVVDEILHRTEKTRRVVAVLPYNHDTNEIFPEIGGPFLTNNTTTHATSRSYFEHDNFLGNKTAFSQLIQPLLG
jgi:hypothetical protein